MSLTNRSTKIATVPGYRREGVTSRGGASEASGATLTGDVDGSSRYMYVCIRASSPWANYSTRMRGWCWVSNFRNLFLPGKETLEKKDLLLRSGLEPGSDALQTTAFATEPMGLWQLWTSNLALILLTVAVSVDYSRIATMAMHQIYLEKANRLRHCKVCLLYSL